MEYLFCGGHTFLSGLLFLTLQDQSHSRLLEFPHLSVVPHSQYKIKIWTFEIQYAELFTPNIYPI